MATKYEAKRQAAANMIFNKESLPSNGETVTGTPIDLTLTQQYNKLEKLYKQEMSKWWEATSLQQYLDCGRVPRGLRIFTTPTYEKPNPRMFCDLV